MKHVDLHHSHKAARQKIMLVALLLLAITLWVVSLLLLVQVTITLLDTLAMIVDLAQMS